MNTKPYRTYIWTPNETTKKPKENMYTTDTNTWTVSVVFFDGFIRLYKITSAIASDQNFLCTLGNRHCKHASHQAQTHQQKHWFLNEQLFSSHFLLFVELENSLWNYNMLLSLDSQIMKCSRFEMKCSELI